MVSSRKIKQLALVLGACGLAVYQVGCPSLSTLQTSRTVPQGQIRGAVAIEGVGIAAESDSIEGAQVEGSIRYGVTDFMDMHAKLYLVGAEIGATFQLVRGDFDMALATNISGIYIGAGDDTVGLLYPAVNLLMGVHASDSLTFQFGPKFTFGIAFGTATGASASSLGLMGGLYFGVPIKVGRAFWIAPEINVYSNLATSGVDSFSGVIWQGGLGLYFGGAEDEGGDMDAPPPAGPMPPPGY